MGVVYVPGAVQEKLELMFFNLGRSASGTAPSHLCLCIEKVRHCEGHLITNEAKHTFKSPA